MVERRNDHHLFLEHRYALQRRVQHRAVDERGHQAARQHAFEHGPGGPGGQVKVNLGVALVIGGQQRRDAHRRRAFQRSEGKGALRVFTRHGQPRLMDQVEDAPGIFEEVPTRRRQAQAALLANEQLYTQVLLQLLDARGQVRRHPMDVLRGGADAALLCHGLEDLQLHQVHRHSPNVNVSLIIIQFSLKP